MTAPTPVGHTLPLWVARSAVSGASGRNLGRSDNARRDMIAAMDEYTPAHDETLTEDWYPSVDALETARALLLVDQEAMDREGPFASVNYDAEAMTQQFTALYDGCRLDEVDAQLLNAAESAGDRTWTGVWIEWMRLKNVDRYDRNRTAYGRKMLIGWITSGRHEEAVVEDAPDSTLDPAWMPPISAYHAAEILTDDLPLAAVHTQFHMQYDGRTLESMEACDWIRDEEVTSWQAVWLTYVRQVAVSRRERLARQARSEVDELTAAAVVREQGGLRLLRGAG